jgi:hypothetical protein
MNAAVGAFAYILVSNLLSCAAAYGRFADILPSAENMFPPLPSLLRPLDIEYVQSVHASSISRFTRATAS